MAFKLPTFNLTCDIYTGPWVSRSHRLTVACNLAFGKREQYIPFNLGAQPNELLTNFNMILLLPALTDVRARIIAPHGDVIEVPAASGRWYGVVAVDDIGKGFANEHRAAGLEQISQYRDPASYSGLFWPVPMP